MKTPKSCLACLAILAIVLISSQASAVLLIGDAVVSFPDQVKKDKDGTANIIIDIDFKGKHLNPDSFPIDITIYNETNKIISDNEINENNVTYYEDYHTSISLKTHQSGLIHYYLMVISNHNIIISEWHNVTISEYSNENVKIAMNLGFISIIAILAIIGIVGVVSTRYVIHNKMTSKMSVSEIETGDTEISLHS